MLNLVKLQGLRPGDKVVTVSFYLDGEDNYEGLYWNQVS